MDTQFQLVGGDQMLSLLLHREQGTAGAMGRALYEEAQIAFRNSQKQVPYRKGILKGSGRIHPPSVVGDTVDVQLGYGGAARKYAAAVHEIRKNYRKGKKAFYLSDPVEARIPGLDRRLGKRMDRILGDG